MSTTQKALVLNEPFGQFNVQEVEVYQPGPGEILIKVQAAALNPVDWKIKKYNVVIDGYPAILGSDIAGDVEVIGEGVSDFRKGDRVFCPSVISKDLGSFQQYVLASAATTSKIPPQFSYDEISTLPLALSTAYSGLYARSPHGLGIDLPDTKASLQKYSGTPILILGGASSVGQIAIQLAKYSDFSPIITTASLKHADNLREMGATYILDRNLISADLKKEIKKVTNKPIALIYDPISIESTQQVAFNALAPGGSVALVLPAVVEATEGRHIAHVIAGLRMAHNIPLLGNLYHDKVYELLVEGIIKPNRFEILSNGLAGIPDGLARLEADQVSRLKLVAHPQETP